MLIGRASKAVFASTVAAVALIGALAVGPSARAQEAAPIAPELTGLGTLHLKVTTGVPRAQIFFDQGLRLLYAFNHAEAIRAFREAARLDPGLAMAYWGRALALGPNLNAPMTEENGRQAYAAVRQAVAAAAGATPRERALIDALAKRYAADGKGDRPALDKAYAIAMGEVAARFPDDPDVLTVAADAQMNTMPWDYWQKDGTAKPETARTIEMLEHAIAKAPDHAGALHYHIHLLEASNDPDRAERSADRLGDLMPAAGHMVHMPAHIYLRVGRYADAAEANVRAIAADEDYLAQCQAQGLYPISYYPHNLHFLWAAATLEGRSEVAVDAARKTAAKVPHHHAGAVAWTADFPVTPMLAYVRFGLWQDVLTEPQPPANQPYAIGIWHYTRGLAFVARGRLDQAAAELSALEAAMQHEAFKTTLKDLPMLTNLQIASRIVASELGLKRANADAAIALMREAVAIEDAIPYNEPPVWHQPTRQVLGAILLESGRPAEAEAVYREDLTRFRENGWSLFGLAQSLEAQKRASEAREVRQRFAKAWARADVTLTSSRVMTATGGSAPARADTAHSHHHAATAQEQIVELADGTRLAYVEHGDATGTPVVLLHGYTDSWRSYERVLPYLASSLHVFAITQRGHGNSSKPDVASGPGIETTDAAVAIYGPAAFARDVAAFLDAKGIEKAVIVGHSMGASVAQRFAIDYPQRTQALVLEGAFLPKPGNVEVAKFWKEVAELADPIDPGFAREFQQSTLARPVPADLFTAAVGESLKVPARVWKAVLQPMLTTDFVADLAVVKVPTLLIWGDRDAFTGRAEQDALAKAISGSRLVVYTGTGHSPHWEEPQRFATQVSSFVASLTSEAAMPFTGPVSALMTAVWTGRTDDVRRLLAEGADPDLPVGKPPLTAWQVAVIADDQPSLALFAARGANRPKAHYTPNLFKAALQRGDTKLVAEFINAGASLVFSDLEYSPLSVAAASGNAELIRQLLDAGAFIDYQDRFGDTALMAAVRSGKIDAVRMLLDRKANVALADADGRTAASWAVAMGRPSIVALLDPSLAPARHKEGQASHARSVPVRAAVARSLALLEQVGATVNERRACASCHHQGMLLPVIGVARRQGFAVDEARAKAQEDRLRGMLTSFEPSMRAAHEGGEDAAVGFGLGFFGQMTSGASWLLDALSSSGSPAQAIEAAVADTIARTQLPDGRWRVGMPRVPIQDTDLEATAIAVRMLAAHASNREDANQRVANAARWLIAAPAPTTVDKIYRLLGLYWAGADRASIKAASKAVLEAQDERGGWAQLPGMNADAYATGLAMVALRETGLDPADGAYRRGVAYLLRTQHEDGSWFVHKRAASFNQYYETGFPYGMHQFSSFTGTAWATMALMYASGPDHGRAGR